MVLGDGPDGAVVLGRSDALAGVDAALRDFERLLGGVQVLQGNQSAGIGVHAIHSDGFLFKVSGVLLTAGSVLLAW